DRSLLTLHLHGPHPGGESGPGLLLEEALPVDAVREAGEHQRPVPEVGQHPGGDGLVVADQGALAEPVLGPEGLVEIGEGNDPLLAAPGWQAILGALVVAEAAEHRSAR